MTSIIRPAILAIAVALAPLLASAEPMAAQDMTYEQLQTGLTLAGFKVGSASYWTEDVLTFRALGELDEEPTSLWVFVYPTREIAVAAHQDAVRDEPQRLPRTIFDSDEHGPQLLSGFGASYWWRNVANVQQAKASDVAAWPPEPDESRSQAARGSVCRPQKTFREPSSAVSSLMSSRAFCDEVISS